MAKQQKKITSSYAKKECKVVRRFRNSRERVILEDYFFELIRDANTSVAELEKVIDVYPEILMSTLRYNSAHMPLQQACWYGCSYEVIELLVRRNPDVLRIADERGNLPLHYWRGCTTQAESVEENLSIIKLLVDTYPLSVQIQGSMGQTPLHRFCQEAFASPVIEFLMKCYPQALQIRDAYGCTPFHCACKRGKDLSVIKLLYTAFPLAVRWQTDEFGLRLYCGNTPLSTSCHQGFMGVIEYISYECWPIACLCYSKFEPLFSYSTCSFDLKVKICKFLENVRNEATYALIDVALHNKHILPDNVITHIAQCVMPLCLDSMSKSSTTPISGQHNCQLVLDQLSRMNLDGCTLLSIVESNELQSLLKPEGDHEKLQELVDSVIRMNRAGRAVYLAEDPDNKQEGVKVLHATTTSLDGLFFHVRENPLLCNQSDIGPSCRP